MGDKYLKIKIGKHFTLTALAEHLNETFGVKSSGVKFSAIDVQKYVGRGHLPAYLGGNILKELRSEKVGVKLIEISDKMHDSCVKTDKKTDKDEDR